ncbi:ferritin-like domain-containing protein, partial [Streptomyces sp. SM12]
MTGLWPAGDPGADVALLAVQAALAAEHATVYGYGVVGAWAGDDARDEVRRLLEAHRDQRDGLRRSVRELGGSPVAASAGYALPFPVGDAISATALAAVLEDRLAGAYADLVRAG